MNNLVCESVAYLTSVHFSAVETGVRVHNFGVQICVEHSKANVMKDNFQILDKFLLAFPLQHFPAERGATNHFQCAGRSELEHVDWLFVLVVLAHVGDHFRHAIGEDRYKAVEDACVERWVERFPMYSPFAIIRRKQSVFHAHEIIHERLVDTDRLGHNLLYQIRMRWTDDRVRSEAELEDAFVILVRARKALEDLVRVLLGKLESIAENWVHRFNARYFFGKLKLYLAVQVERKDTETKQQNRYHLDHLRTIDY